MKIPREFPQFKDQKTLVLVTGKQVAKAYLAENGIIDKVFEFKIEKPKFSDNEGAFKSRGHGKTIRSGIAREENKDVILLDFLKLLDKELKKIGKGQYPKITDLFILCPDYHKAVIQKALPKILSSKLRKLIEGNYLKTNRTSILKLL